VTGMVIVTTALQDLLEKQVESAARRLAQLGLTANVDEVLARVSDSELSTWRNNEFYTYARLLMAQQKFADSLKVLKRLEGAAQAVRMEYLVSRAQVMQAVVHFQAGDVEPAMRLMSPLLERTARMDSNAVRIYLPAGETGRTLLQEAARRGLHPEHVSRLLAEFPPEPSPAQTSNLSECLTERELDVLRLMAAGLKNQEIGAKLYISLNTIRYHTTNLFGKLGVDNRTAAVARARELGIL